MRSCPNCGAQFSDDEVFCPVCGQEVQIVPDFVTAEIQLQELHKRIEEEERAQKEARERAEMIQKRVRQRRNHIILAVCLIAAAIAACILGSYYMKVQKEHNTFSYQFAQAEEAMKAGDVDLAAEYITRALSMNPEDRDALLLQVDIFLAQEKKDDAENLLFHFMELFPDDEEGYIYLIELYLEEGRTEDVSALLASCTHPSVLKKYARLLPSGPVFNPGEGVYNTDQEIELTTEVKGKIYYTTDGSDPTASSELYVGPVELTEGITTVKAMLITDEGFPSPLAAAVYQIQYDAPPAPEVSPESGRFTITKNIDDKGRVTYLQTAAATKITVTYPDGYICHYSFDEKPTKESPVYSEPIEMKEGEHIFYAVLESDTGKLGMIASVTYIYETIIITPTPTPTPTPTQRTYYSGGGSGRSATPTPAPADSGSVPSGGGGDVPVPSEGGETDGGESGGDAAPAEGGGESGGDAAPAEGGGDSGGGDAAPAPAPADGGGEAAPAPAPADGGGGGGESSAQAAPQAAPEG